MNKFWTILTVAVCIGSASASSSDQEVQGRTLGTLTLNEQSALASLAADCPHSDRHSRPGLGHFSGSLLTAQHSSTLCQDSSFKSKTESTS